MDYKVTWLDHEDNVLGDQVFEDQVFEDNDLPGLVRSILTMLTDDTPPEDRVPGNVVPEGTTHFTVELYDQ